jgi:tuftelin-interacting protein 11
LILPRIQSEVDAWNPLTDLIPIHAWIHPWLPRLSARLEIVYPTIRQKMAQALVAWQPSDQSARSVLMPWVPVFSKGAMDAFLVKNILPKLQQALMSWTIHSNTHQQDWGTSAIGCTLIMSHTWTNCFSFIRCLEVGNAMEGFDANAQPSVHAGEVLFPQMAAGLRQSAQSNQSQIRRNHHLVQDVEDLLPAGYCSTSCHKRLLSLFKYIFQMKINSFWSWNVEQFTRALDLINRSVAAGNQASAIPPPLPPPMLNPVMAPLAPPVVLAETLVQQGFRELVEYQCAQQGILFVPLVNRWQAGRPVFRVGNVLSYFDRQVRIIFTFCFECSEFFFHCRKYR